MNAKMLVDLIVTLSVIAGATIAVVKFLDVWKTKIKEKSVGATKIMELEKADILVREDLRRLAERVDQKEAHQDEEIESLNNHYNKLIDKVWDFLSRK